MIRIMIAIEGPEGKQPDMFARCFSDGHETKEEVELSKKIQKLLMSIEAPVTQLKEYDHD